ncbi:GAF domain-containing protein [Melghirimyces profundicolus]|uniref:GAF domain-containing protein n=1 Tax=Melghirimyces profundicolus TaxID=1242148 RepID=A0A2T6C0L2_9BACL|nr:sigma-54-dependent Fis family transcriptional regulator [Melghirimyces profundicolus]PTX61850.1 GAF domain-containing protein [Melghirimyces profundicolus]
MTISLPMNIWKRFVREGTLDENRIEKVIRESWIRSKEYAIDPHRDRGNVLLTKGELFERREHLSWMWEEAEKYVKQLQQLLHQHRMIVLLTDEEGHLLAGDGHPATKAAAEKIRFVPGARWSERDVGTNAIGTALETRQPVYVEGYQHYTVATHPWCCAAAPVRTKTGNVLCVLNVSGPLEQAHPYLLTIVSTMAMSLEERIQRIEPGTVAGFQGVIGNSRAFQQTIEMAEQAALVDHPVCLTGESGTGKELLARYIHDRSTRAREPFVALNCGALSPQLLESELFGYAPGAFTGAQPKGNPGKLRLAHRGTVFLDEVGEMNERMQVALLRFLQEKTIRPLGSSREIHIDARVITATHRSLPERIREGKFREDLFYRLYVLPIELPPLRERLEDLPALVDHLSKELDLPRPLSTAAFRVLQRYGWPGNIRELKNVLLSSSLFSKHETIQEEEVRRILSKGELRKTVETERSRTQAVKRALKESSGNISKAARLLGVSRSTLYRWMKQSETSFRDTVKQ